MSSLLPASFVICVFTRLILFLLRHVPGRALAMSIDSHVSEAAESYGSELALIHTACSLRYQVQK